MSDVDEVGERLRRAFAALTELPPSARPRWHQRLIAVTNTTKRDLTGAVEQLDRYDRDWAARAGEDGSPEGAHSERPGSSERT